MSLASTPVKLAWMSAARQYPLGFSMDMLRRLEWLDYSDKHQSYVVEDDYDAEFQYHKTPLAPLFALSAIRYPNTQQRIIYTGSFSKILFKTLRIGYLVVPQQLVDTFIKVQRLRGNLASLPLQPAVADFINHRRFASHLRRMRRCYQQRRDFLHTHLNEQLGHLLDVELPESGMNLLARLKSENSLCTDTYLESQLAQLGINTPALSPHYSKGPEQGLILGFSGSTEEKLIQGTAQIARQLQAF